MFIAQVVVLTGLLALAAEAAPGLLHGGYALPAATSYSSRVDVHSKPIVYAAAPVITKTVVAAVPAYSHASYGGYHATPLVSSYGYGVGHGSGLGIGHGLGLGSGLALGYGGLGHSYGGIGHGYSGGLGHTSYGFGGHGYGLGGHGYGSSYGHGW